MTAIATMAALRQIGLASSSFCVSRPRLAAHIGDRAGHLVRRLNHLGVHLVGALGRDEVGDLCDGIDVRGFDVSCCRMPKAVSPGTPTVGWPDAAVCWK